jgi:hypothetical protein
VLQMRISDLKILLFLACVFFLSKTALAQKVVVIDTAIKQHKFIRNELDYLKDKSDKLTFEEVKRLDANFLPNNVYYPGNNIDKYAYWYRIKVRFTESVTKKRSLFEFFDQTTDEVTAYIPDGKGGYNISRSGANANFTNRLYFHKNFEFLITDPSKGEHTYYFKVRSKNPVKVIIVYRTVDYFIQYALLEYFSFGLFYGMVLIFCFHNLLMFTAIRKKQYLYYVIYIICVALYEMSVDGIAFQYLWPNTPALNDYMYGIAMYLVSVFALIFTKELLQVKQKSYRLYYAINVILILRTVYFLYCLLFNKGLFIYKFIEVIPLFIAFITGINIYRRGFKPARFFVLAYAVLFTGFIVKAITALGYAYFLPEFLSYYSIGFCFVVEMLFLSFAIGDQVRIMRREKDAALDETIQQMDINNKLKDTINQELELQVKARTKEVIKKSEEILTQSQTIEQQNQLLESTNHQLEVQAAEINRMNILLAKDNVQLKNDIEKVTDARALSTELNFEEFSAKYPDQESCNKFLSDLKWQNGYKCIRCNHDSYSAGRVPYSRRCTKCSYEESAMHNTIFENNRIPINKAFYIVYLVYSSKGTISSYQLSQKIGIRQSTCWSYAIRIKKVLSEQKRARKKGTQQGWVALVM